MKVAKTKISMKLLGGLFISIFLLNGFAFGDETNNISKFTAIWQKAIKTQDQRDRVSALTKIYEQNSGDPAYLSWLNLEVSALLGSSNIQQTALKALDGITNELSGRKSGFAWASSGRVKLLQMISKIKTDLQFDYFMQALPLILEGYSEAPGIRLELHQQDDESNLEGVAYDKMRISRQIIYNAPRITDADQIDKYLDVKERDLERLSRPTVQRQSFLNQMLIFCRSRLSYFKNS